MTNYIFVTGGVVSSLGKGVTAAALGRLLKSRGVTVSIQKLDPYLNVDPGTMSPYQHGEVFVTEDGAETDLDLGHYERFIDENLSRASNVTSGQIYAEVIGRERRGDYLGGTIQVIPHVTNEIKRRIAAVAKASEAQVVIVEVGGTVGDIEGLPFLEAIRQMRKDVGRDKTLYLHVTWMPYVAASGELKTKPTQHSVRELRSIGIQPDVIVCRSDHPVEDSLREKIALFCDVDVEAVVPLVTADTVYAVPLELEQSRLAHYVLSRLGYSQAVATAAEHGDHLAEWRALVARAREDKPMLKIGVVGKYVELEDAYMSVREALLHAAWALGYGVEITWISSEDLEKGRSAHLLETVDGIVVPGGFGYRGIEGKIVAARFARQQKVPYLGLCLGMQVLCIEFARHVFDSDEPNSVEFDPTTRVPVIDLMPDQRAVEELGGTMRLGIYPCNLVAGTRAAAAYQVNTVMERHRHRFEFNNAYRAILEKAGLVFSGLSPDGRLVEIAELRDHPWMLGSQFHPEFKSRPTAPRPLFLGFIRAVEAHVRGRAQLAESGAVKHVRD
ncbi:CTP synthase [Candidatus Amarolinea aalborgensis]|uniref:CTP synthase n=1 Tax=Candidatus Amarolinea aalborgensis TaxID=2249329 RepID=UPI003BF9E4F7